MAAAVAGMLAASGTALAHDATFVSSPPPALALTSAATAPLLPPLVLADPAAPSGDVRQLLSDPFERCVAACTRQEKGPLTDDILSQLGQLPLIDTVMMPVTRGVTIETGEGKPALTIAVKPTKITRGSGLVAITRF